MLMGKIRRGFHGICLRNSPSTKLSTELLKLLLKSSKCMAQAASMNRALSTDDHNHVISESLIFLYWYLEKLIEGRASVRKRVDILYRDFLWEFEVFREQVDHYESTSKTRHQQYCTIFHDANGSVALAERIAVAFVANVLCGDEPCIITPFILSGSIDTVQTFARLIFQALSVPIRDR